MIERSVKLPSPPIPFQTLRPDCFGFKSICRCNALTEMVCGVRKCSFYKTVEQYEADKEKYAVRLNGGD